MHLLFGGSGGEKDIYSTTLRHSSSHEEAEQDERYGNVGGIYKVGIIWREQGQGLSNWNGSLCNGRHVY